MSEGNGYWKHSSGVVVPRGSTYLGTLSEEELDALEARSRARGAREFQTRARLPDTTEEDRGLQAFCEWLNGYRFDVLGVVTFSDEMLKKLEISDTGRAVQYVGRQLIRSFKLGPGYRKGFENRFALSGEYHREGRATIPHVHLALESHRLRTDKLCRGMWAHFYPRCGRAWFEPMHDTNAATLYGLKDVFKNALSDSEASWFRLNVHRNQRRTRARCSGGV